MQGSVSILNVSPEAAAMIASGGRISTMDGTAGEIYAKSLAAGQEKNEKLIGKVLSSGHTSVLEHCYVNLSFENSKDLSQKVSFSYQINGRSSSGSTSQPRKNISFSAFSFGKVKYVHKASVQSSPLSL